MLLCFILGGLWPFGDRQVLAHDMWHQYYPFFVSFREKLRSGGSLQYLREAVMGFGYLPLYAYYLSSPLYLLSVLVPASLLREFFALLVLTKIGLAGLFFAVFLRTAFRRNEPALVPFSMMYALCSLVAGYYWNIIWLDALALLPVAGAGQLSQRLPALAEGGGGGGTEGDHRLPCEVICLHKSVDRPCAAAPPDGIAQIDGAIRLYKYKSQPKMFSLVVPKASAINS